MKTFVQLKILENLHVSWQLGQVVQDNGLRKHRPEVSDPELGRDTVAGSGKFFKNLGSRKLDFRHSEAACYNVSFSRPNPLTTPLPHPPQDPPQPEYFKPLEPVLVYRDQGC